MPRSGRVQPIPTINDPNVSGQSRHLGSGSRGQNMSFKKFTTSAAVIAGLIAANMGPLATAASAHDRWSNGHGNGYGNGYARHYDGPRRFHDHGPRYRYANKRHNRGKDIAKGLAIGLGVLAVGSILSSAHNR